jgi:hypothetical protein
MHKSEEESLSEDDFETLLLEAVDEGLSSLGDSSKHAIYFHLQRTFNLDKSQIPKNIDAFDEAIKKIFGIGANFLEILIMQKLHQKAAQTIRLQAPEELTLQEYVEQAKRSFLRNRQSTIEIPEHETITIER